MGNYLELEVRKMKPTKKHRAAIWECMLGTVFAMNPKGDIRYFDYDWDKAKEFAQLGDDLRIAKHAGEYRIGHGNNPEGCTPHKGQTVLYTK